MASTSHTRSYFDFDVSVGFRQFEGNIYLQVYADMTMRDALGFLEDDPRVVEYYYQNSGDRPKRISEEDWAERERVWDAMDTQGNWADLLVLNICKWHMFYHVDPWLDFLRELGKEPVAAESSVETTTE